GIGRKRRRPAAAEDEQFRLFRRGRADDVGDVRAQISVEIVAADDECRRGHALNPISRVFTMRPASIDVTPASTIASPFAPTIDVETPEPCAVIGCATSSPLSSVETRTRKYARRSPFERSGASSRTFATGGRMSVVIPITFRKAGATKRRKETMLETGLPG